MRCSFTVAIRVDLNYDSEAHLKVSSHARFLKCFPRSRCWQSFIEFPTALSKLRSLICKIKTRNQKQKKFKTNWFDIEIVSDLWEHELSPFLRTYDEHLEGMVDDALRTRFVDLELVRNASAPTKARDNIRLKRSSMS